jgi:hypothetical protein
MVQRRLRAGFEAQAQALQLGVRRQALGKAVLDVPLLEPEKLRLHPVGLIERRGIVEHADYDGLARQPAGRRDLAVDVGADRHYVLDDLGVARCVARKLHVRAVERPGADLLGAAGGGPVLAQEQAGLVRMLM